MGFDKDTVFPKLAIERINEVLSREGKQTYPKDDWRTRDCIEEHMHHAKQHIDAWFERRSQVEFLKSACDFEWDCTDTEDHLGHALTRLAMAAELEELSAL